MVFICITQMTSGVQHLYICSLAICISSWRNVYSDVYSELNIESLNLCQSGNSECDLFGTRVFIDVINLS